MPSILELFKTTPGRYSQPKENPIDFSAVPSVSSPRKVDTTPFSIDDSKTIDRRGVYYNSTIYTSGVNYSLLDFTKKNGGEINIFSNNNNLGKKLNKGFNKILGISVFDQVRNNIEQDLNGIRISSGVERNNIQIYGTDALRFATRSTTMLTLMQQDRGQSGRGLLTGIVQTIDKGLSSVKGFLGYPEPQNPSNVIRIGRRQRFSAFSPKEGALLAQALDSVFGGQWRGNEQKTMITIAKIKNKTGGNELGRLIKDSLGTDPKTVGAQFVGNGIQLVKEKARNLLFGSGELLLNNVRPSDYGAYGSGDKSYSQIKRDSTKPWFQDEEQTQLLDLIERYSPVHGIDRIGKPRTKLKPYSGTGQFGYTEYAFKKIDTDLTQYDSGGWPKYSPNYIQPNNYSDTAYVSGSTTQLLKQKSLSRYRGIQDDGDIISQTGAKFTGSLDTNTGEFELNGQKYKDLVPMFINKIGESPTMFRTSINGLTENFTPTWNTNKFLGNPFNFYTYSGIERSVTFNLQVYAFSKKELTSNWQKLSTLTLMTYPTINSNALVTPPIIEFRLGDIYKNKKGFIESLSYTMPDIGLWETETDGSILPKFIDVSLTIKFIETRAVLDNPYSYNFTPKT
jgi:hypothetical protein